MAMRFLLAAASILGLAAPGLAQDAAILGSDAITSEVVASSYRGLAPAISDLGRGRTALIEGRYSTARFLLAPLADGSMDPRIHMLAGYADLGAGYPRKAARRFERGLELDRKSALARQGLALAYVAQGQVDAARTQLAALESARDRCREFCRSAANYDSAIASLRRVLD